LAKEVYDPEVLLQEDFAPVLQAALERLDRQLASVENPAQRAGAMEVISARSGVPCRRIYGYLHGENTFVDLDIADRLLMAVDLYVELVFPESAFYTASVVRKAALEQTEMMDAWCRHRGWVMPAMGSQERRTIPGKIRRTAWKEAQERELLVAERQAAVVEPVIEPVLGDDVSIDFEHEHVLSDAMLEELMGSVAA